MADNIHISLEYESKFESNQLKLMLIFFLNDETRVAMSESGFFSCKTGKNRVYAEIPLDCFVNEEYKVEISIYDCSSGTLIRHDCAKDAFYFKVHTPENGDLSDVWTPGSWGRMQAKPIRVRND